MTPKKFLTETEKIIKKKYELEGYECLRKGHPDFVFYKRVGKKIKNVLFVEVKSNGDKLTDSQSEYKKIIESLGFKHKVREISEEAKKEVVEAKKDGFKAFREGHPNGYFRVFVERKEDFALHAKGEQDE